MNKIVTCAIRRLESFNLYPASGDPVVRIRATVVKDNVGRFDPDDWVLTSSVVGSEQGNGFIDYYGCIYIVDTALVRANVST